MREPWTDFNTVEAAPCNARLWAMALESRLAEVHRVLSADLPSPRSCRVRIRQALRLLEAELT